MDNIEKFLLICWIMKWHILLLGTFLGVFFYYESRHPESTDA